jgi:elongation factor P hydroxylase
LILLFAVTYLATEGSRLVRGGAEPLYRRATDAAPAEIVFAHGFFASALHEIAHWCVAGPARRKLVDFGYWYRPDDRKAGDQAEFEIVEVKPQALEWIFSVAAGTPFHFSADNLTPGGAEPGAGWIAFQDAVVAQARRYAERMPLRAATFAERLSARFGTSDAWRRPESYAR